MRRLYVAAVVLAACRVGDLVDNPGGGARLQFSVQPTGADSGRPITPPVKVAVLDGAGRPDTTFRDSVAIALAQNPGNAVLSGRTVAAVDRGFATFADLRLNKPGSGYVLRASAPARPNAMSAPFAVSSESVPPPPATPRLAFTVQPTATQVGATITPAVRVAARDSAGATITSFTGTITIAIGANPAGGTLSGTMTAAASSGVATFANLRIDRAGNGYTLTAAASGAAGATSSAFNVTPPPPPQAKRLAFVVQPSATVAGNAIAPAVQVVAQDSAGNVVTGFTGTITIALGANPGGGTLSGTLSAAATSGVATFSSLRIDRAGNGYTLTAVASGLTGATSSAFNVTAPPPLPATRVAFVVQPNNVEAGTTMTPAVQIAARDNSGATVTSFTGTITLAIGSNPGGGTLSGTTSATAVNGVATFGGLRIDRAGTGYTLTAASGSLAGATSAAFNVTAPPPPTATGLRFIVQPSNVGLNQAISPPVQVMVVDAAGNQVPGYTGAVTIDLAPNLLNAAVYGTLTVNAVNGVATFSNLRVNLVGVDFHLRAAFAGQAPIVTSDAFVVLL